jgi:DNA polymerase-3 subunit epsilon/ATP-dependent DNA helicase DinG
MPQTYVSLDLETTGTRPGRDEIFEIAAVKFRGDSVLDTWHTLVRPGRPVPHGVRRLTGIEVAELTSAPPLDAVKRDLIAFVGEAPLVGQSVQNDIDFLTNAGVKLPGPAFDTFELASLLLPELTEYSLAAVAAHFAIPYPQHHRALPDAEAAHKVFTALRHKAESLEPAVLTEIARLLRRFGGPLFVFFSECERARLGEGFGTSVGARVAARQGLEETNLDFLLHGAPREEPLRPKEPRRSINTPDLSALLAPDGAVAARLPGYEHRPEQLAMLEGVSAALNDRKHLIVEAGTGTGKSVAYLLPAMAFAAENDARVVVSTNTINLQDQLIGKDIPDLISALSGPAGDPALPPVRTAVLKGRTNYLCLRRWSALRGADTLNWEEAKVLIRTLIWLPQTGSGDREELNLETAEAGVWSRISAQADECLASACTHLKRGTCFLFRARRNAERAHLVVVNHALLMSDLLAESQLIPDYDYLVVDEAHHLEDVATGQLGYHIGPRELLGFLDLLWRRLDSERGGGLLAEIGNHFRGSTVPQLRQREIVGLAADQQSAVDGARLSAAELIALSARFLRDHVTGGEFERRLRLTPAARHLTGWAAIERQWETLRGQLGPLIDLVGRLQAAFEPFESAKVLDYENLMTQLGSIGLAGRLLVERLDGFIAAPAADQIYWLTGTGDTVQMNAAPLDVGVELDRLLFSRKDAVVLTSATLSTAGTFTYIRDRLGMQEGRELLVGSPFDYAGSTLLAIPTDIPEPNRPDYPRRLEQAVLEICKAAEGRTLVLFTAYAALRQVDRAIRGELERQDILVLAHGQDGSRKQLLRSFRSNPRAVLLGTSSFWEGIDIAGEALSVVVLTKLPFGVPSDPVYAARSERLDDPFNQFQVPQSILKFRQGFGRLIRRRTDRGAVVILDCRVDTKEYGKAFLRSLPRCTERRGPVTRLAGEIAGWLRKDAEIGETPV